MFGSLCAARCWNQLRAVVAFLPAHQHPVKPYCRGGPLTEIPEHLLKRSKAAKSASTGGDPGAGDDASPVAASAGSAPVAAAAAPAVPAAALPNLDPEPVPVVPDSVFVTASKGRKRIPVWALPVVAALPIWAISFAGTMQQPEVEDPLLIESVLFYSQAGCAGCHGSSGGGGLGYPLADGNVLETFPDPIDHMVHVARGSSAIAEQEYGAERSDGRRVSEARGRGQMPAQETQISQVELELITFHERATLSGEDTSTPGYEEWMEHMREAFESGDDDAIDLDFLLDCADPAITPGATGVGSDDENRPCPGPNTEAEEGDNTESALGS